jgi:hypothetical protein
MRVKTTDNRAWHSVSFARALLAPGLLLPGLTTASPAMAQWLGAVGKIITLSFTKDSSGWCEITDFTVSGG